VRSELPLLAMEHYTRGTFTSRHFLTSTSTAATSALTALLSLSTPSTSRRQLDSPSL
jgi:hypothetical protein